MKKLLAAACIVSALAFSAPARADLDYEQMKKDCGHVSELTTHYEACVAAVTYAEKRFAMFRELGSSSTAPVEVYEAQLTAWQRAMHEIATEFPTVWAKRLMIN